MRRARAPADEPRTGVSAPIADRGVTRSLAAIGAEAAAPPAAVRAAAQILHDDEATRDLLRSVTESAGFDVSCPASVFDLVLADSPAEACLVLLAMTSVDERDLEIVTRLRARSPGVSIVVLHPAGLRERAARALALGADATLGEPFYPSEIASLARRALARAVTGAAAPAVQPVRTSEPPQVADPATATPPASPPPAGAAERLALAVAKAIRAPVAALEQGLAAAEAGDDVDVASLRAEVRRIAGLGEGLAGFAGPQDLELRPADVANLVTGVFVSRDVGAAGAEIGVRLGDARVEILAAPDVLRVGLEALRNRAVRVTPPEGKISVRTRSRVVDRVRMVEISVTDGGPALTQEQRASLFDPFAGGVPADDDADDHSGLEMAALAGIVRAHGGTLLALAAGATGTIVVIRLPVREPDPARAGTARVERE